MYCYALLCILGYGYIRDLLVSVGERNPNTISEDRAILNILKPAFIHEIHPIDCVDHLLARGVLNDRDREEIEAEKDRRGDTAATCLLLNRLPGRGPYWLAQFRDTLRSLGCPDLASTLDVPEVTVLKPGNTLLKYLVNDAMVMAKLNYF